MKFDPENYSFVFAHINETDYDEQMRTITNWLLYWLKFRFMCKESGTVVFDIDETLIDKEEKVISDMYAVYKLCVDLGFVVNIVTARPESKNNRARTDDMLLRNGIDTYEALYMMPSEINPTFESISTYKYNARLDIEKRHQILANCGDMWSDHCKYPSKIEHMSQRSSKECAILFLPGNTYPSIKLPSSNA